MKKICAITMARNDEFFLRHWIEYYGSQLGKENLYIFLDGADQPIPENAGEASVTHCERILGQVVRADKRRVSYLSDAAVKLLKKYDIVIGTDADEFLIVDPDCNETLQSYLSKSKIKTSLSGLGLDVGQKMGVEPAINGSFPFLSQRKYAVLSPRYTKPVVLAKPVQWGSGFHRVKKHNFRIDRNLYLFHFGVFDMKMLQKRLQDNDRMTGGWERHIRKRARTIQAITNRKAKNGETMIPVVRTFQTFCRPVFAWNKPTLLGMNPVIKIPEKFLRNPIV